MILRTKIQWAISPKERHRDNEQEEKETRENEEAEKKIKIKKKEFLFQFTINSVISSAEERPDITGRTNEKCWLHDVGEE